MRSVAAWASASASEAVFSCSDCASNSIRASANFSSSRAACSSALFSAAVRTGTPQPAGTQPNNGQQIAILDPTAATDGSAAQSYIYLFLQPGGSHFNSSNGYVSLQRDNGPVNSMGVDTDAA